MTKESSWGTVNELIQASATALVTGAAFNSNETVPLELQLLIPLINPLRSAEGTPLTYFKEV